MPACEPDDVPARQDKVTETLVADTTPGQVAAQVPGAGTDMALSLDVPSMVSLDAATAATEAVACASASSADADAQITALYGAHYRSLVRLATLLVHDIATAEEVVQDSFVALHAGLHRLRDSEKTLSYLRAAVVNRSRSVLRHRAVVDRNVPKPNPDMPSAEHGAMALLERSLVVAALRALPERQREVVVLRFYGDLSEAQIAMTMGITRGAVKSHTSRAMAALRSVLELDP
jgi:RNA polymerase sigma-70 factor (sigma-E family)